MRVFFTWVILFNPFIYESKICMHRRYELKERLRFSLFKFFLCDSQRVDVDMVIAPVILIVYTFFMQRSTDRCYYSHDQIR